MADRALVARVHRAELLKFILPRAVVHGVQGGEMFVGENGPAPWALVVNRFGFAQCLGQPDVPELISAITEGTALRERYLLWYDAPQAVVGALRALDLKGFKERTRVRYDPWSGEPSRLQAILDGPPENLRCVPLTNDLLPACEVFGLHLTSRFWDSEEDLLAKAGAQVLLHDGSPAAICYAAAVAGSEAELDVVTLPDQRGKGVAKAVCAAFMLGMHRKGIRVVWDAFAANEASTRSALSLGFVERVRYTFTTFAT